jgi:hypothetical protein
MEGKAQSTDENGVEKSVICVPDTPPLGNLRGKCPEKIHVLGDIHGWAPGLINYLIKHKLADISIQDKQLGSDGEINETHMESFFGRTKSGMQSVGLKGFELHEDATVNQGLGPIKARWIAEPNVCFVQIGDVFDRADYSEIAVEILRQLIIDAPDRVFVLVGNHEQFMLENSIDNWLLNEERNAIKDFADLENGTVGKHTRFLPEGGIYADYVEKAREVIFPCYKNSVFTLYLTQAAAQQKANFLNRGMSEDLVKSLLSPGWGPYERVENEIEDLMIKGEHIPGALVALVIGENLFHHAEPGEYLVELTNSMNWIESHNIGWLDYIHGGGSIKGTEHSQLLWERGASSGALSGSPKIGNTLPPLAKEWPGLFRIIHGHTPTISDEEFRRIMNTVTSTTCSYYAHNRNQESVRGMASNIRVYNVDEAMSPVYYQGSKKRDDILRIPNGLRVAADNEIKKSVIIHEEKDLFLESKENRDVRQDTRKLWKWAEGEFRTTPGSTDNDSGLYFHFSEMHWIINASEIGNHFLSTHFKAVQDLILDVIDKSEINLSDLTDSKPEISKILPHLSHEGKHPFRAQFHDKKPSLSAKELSLCVFGFNDNGDIITINGSDESIDYYYLTEKKSKNIESEVNSIRHMKIDLDKPVIFSLDKKYAKSKLRCWLDKNNDETDNDYASISFWPTKPSKSLKINNITTCELIPPKFIKNERQSMVGATFSALASSTEKIISDTIESIIPRGYKSDVTENTSLRDKDFSDSKIPKGYNSGVNKNISLRDKDYSNSEKYTNNSNNNHNARAQVKRRENREFIVPSTLRENENQLTRTPPPQTRKMRKNYGNFIPIKNGVVWKLELCHINEILKDCDMHEINSKYNVTIEIEKRKGMISGFKYLLKITNPPPEIRYIQEITGTLKNIKIRQKLKKNLHGIESKTVLYILKQSSVNKQYERLMNVSVGDEL